MTRDEIVAGAREAIERGSKSFRAASRLFDPITRDRAYLLYCWCRHCDDVCDGQLYGFGVVARGNVSVLRGQTRRVIAGERVEQLPFLALGQLLAECPIPARFLEDHLAGFGMDEVGWRPESEEDLIVYCYHVAGAVGCMMAILMGISAEDTETLERAADLGIAFQLSNIARDIREDLNSGRCYLPREWLAEFGVEPAQLFEASHAAALSTMTRRLVDNVEIYERSARIGAQRLPFRSRLAVLASLRIYGAIGRRVRSLGSTAWDHRVTVSKPRKLAYLVPTFADMRAKLASDIGFRSFGHGDQPPGSLQPYLDRLARLGGPLGLRRLILDLARFSDTTCRELPGELERGGYDLAVIDQSDIASSLVAKALGLPFVNIGNALPLNSEPGVPPPMLPWPYDASPRGIRRNLGGYRVSRVIERPITSVIRRHAARLGRPDIKSADEAWSELAQITQCVRGLDFPRERLPQNFHYVGPIRGPDQPLDFDLPSTGRPLIFCSLGTLQGSRTRMFRAIARAVEPLEADLLIAHGGLLPDRDIASLPGRPMVRAYVPQRAILARSSLAITHCGFNTVMDALSLGVPMVGLPITFEQPATGARLERAGAAVILQRRRTRGRIRDAVEQVLSVSSYRNAAQLLAREISAAGGLNRASDLIEAALPGARQAGPTRARTASGDVRGDIRSGSR